MTQPQSTVRKSWTHRLFGWGKLPPDEKLRLEAEDIRISDEGLRGSITFRNFRKPGRYSAYRKNWFSGSFALTRSRLVLFAHNRPLINLPPDNEKLSVLEFTLESPTKLCVAFDAGVFNEKHSGAIEVRIHTARARELYNAVAGRS